MVKTLVALATERMLLKTSGPTFLRGIEFMYAAGLAPDRLSVMMTSSHKYVLQFHSKCDIRPFAANYPNFGRVLRGIVHVREWRIKSIEFVNVAFYMRDVDNLERAIEKLGVELVLLRNCTYPGVQRGDEAVKFLSALNRKKQAVVCEYGDDRLKHRIGRRTSHNRGRRASRNGQEVLAPQDPAEVVAAPPPAALEAPAPVPRAALEPIPEAPAALNNEPIAAPPPPPEVRRPIPLNPEQARQMLPQIVQQPIAAPAPQPVIQAAPAPVPAPEAAGIQMANALPGRAQSGRVVVGAHVYEFRAVDVPNADNIPAVQNLGHLLNVLNDHTQHDVRVIVLPQDGRVPPQQLQLNNNNVGYRQPSLAVNQEIQNRAAAAVVAVGGALPVQDQHQQREYQQRYQDYQQLYQHNQPPFQQQHFPNYQQMQYENQGRPIRFQPQHFYPEPVQQRQQQQQQQLPAWNGQQQPMNMQNMLPRAAYAPYPMFGVEGNEPLVQRAGDESNDSSDHQEMMYDPEQQRNEAMRDLAADPEAQPNFAPVDEQAVDLEELEEENDDAESEDDDEMEEEEASGDGQFMMVDQPEPVVQ